MRNQAVNPFLPSGEYIPDGEPYVFGDRVYVYGSHDRFGAPIFCVNDYVCWSAPVDDLSKWHYEGVIYKKKQDPRNTLGMRLLFAPDVTKGVDGAYYLYYGIDFMGIMGVAKGNTPIGPFEFHGHIQYNDGTLWGRKKGDSFPFDPAVFVDTDERIYLYSGFYTNIPRIATGMNPCECKGGYVLELEADMKTIKTPEKLLFPKEGPGSFKHHEFFEASSMRKYDNKYYFVYSSRHNHELCYAVSDYPNKEFTFGGTLVSIGDVFLEGRNKEEDALNYLGNTHGGMLHLNNEYYIFYHRQTNQSSYARQACAEKLQRTEDGRFLQAEVTSCGLNEGPLAGTGRYEARIACHLWSKEGTGRYDGPKPKKKLKAHPFITQDEKDEGYKGQQYIKNMRDGAVAGFKYFLIEQVKEITISIRGNATGTMNVYTDSTCSTIATQIEIDINCSKWEVNSASCQIESGKQPLYFQFEGTGSVEFLQFELIR